MAMNQPFTTASPQLVSYDYADIADGTGYVDYYLCQTYTNAVGYSLTPNQDYSAVVSMPDSTDIDYDLSPFVMSQTIEGTARISIPVYLNTANIITIGVSFYKWNGTTETIIGSESVFNKSVNGAEMIYMTSELPLTVIPAGEQLRVRVRFVSGGSITEIYGTDPAGRTDPSLTITTTSKISVPFKLNI